MKKIRLHLKVIPGATKNTIEWYGDKLKVKVGAAPERGRANEAVIAALAERLAIPDSVITLLSGHTNPHKTIEISDMTMEDLLKRVPR